MEHLASFMPRMQPSASVRVDVAKENASTKCLNNIGSRDGLGTWYQQVVNVAMFNLNPMCF